MSFTPEQNEQLAAKMNPEHIRTRKQRQGGQEIDLSYIEGWRAKDEANRIFGYDGWETRVTFCDMVAHYENDGKQRVNYIARVRVIIRAGDALDAIEREDYGFGQGIDRDLGRAHESAVKEAVTDAFKRAISSFGNQFGLALYDKEQRGVGVPAGDDDGQLGWMDPRVTAIARHAKAQGDGKNYILRVLDKISARNGRNFSRLSDLPDDILDQWAAKCGASE